MLWIRFSDRNLQRVVSFNPEKPKILSELEDSDEAGCEVQQIKKGQIDYIMEGNTTINKTKSQKKKLVCHYIHERK